MLDFFFFGEGSTFDCSSTGPSTRTRFSGEDNGGIFRMTGSLCAAGGSGRSRKEKFKVGINEGIWVINFGF